MLNKLSSFFLNLSSGWVVLGCLAVFLIFTALTLPAQNAQANAFSGGLGIPDTTFGYSADQLYHYAETYGPSGRAAYIRARLIFDSFFPLAYGAFLVCATSWLVVRGGLANTNWAHLNLLPLAGILLDYLENLSTALVMARYPRPTPLLPHLAGAFTALKWGFLTLSVIALVGLGGWAFFLGLKGKKEPK